MLTSCGSWQLKQEEIVIRPFQYFYEVHDGFAVSGLLVADQRDHHQILYAQFSHLLQHRVEFCHGGLQQNVQLFLNLFQQDSVSFAVG
jgi:hypothetical protein